MNIKENVSNNTNNIILIFNKIYTNTYITISGYSNSLRIYNSFSQLLDFIIYDALLPRVIFQNNITTMDIHANYTFTITNKRIPDSYMAIVRVTYETPSSFYITLYQNYQEHLDYTKCIACICKNKISKFIPDIKVGTVYYISVHKNYNEDV